MLPSELISAVACYWLLCLGSFHSGVHAIHLYSHIGAFYFHVTAVRLYLCHTELKAVPTHLCIFAKYKFSIWLHNDELFRTGLLNYFHNLFQWLVINSQQISLSHSRLLISYTFSPKLIRI